MIHAKTQAIIIIRSSDWWNRQCELSAELEINLRSFMPFVCRDDSFEAV